MIWVNAKALLVHTHDYTAKKNYSEGEEKSPFSESLP